MRAVLRMELPSHRTFMTCVLRSRLSLFIALSPFYLIEFYHTAQALSIGKALF
jgi:hypothetical protein